jgi:hypothetical protein
MKKIFLIVLVLLIFLPTIAVGENIDANEVLPFSSLPELYQTIKKFSQEDLGMPLDFDIPLETDSLYLNITTTKFYIFMICHKLKFWKDNDPLCSLYVYSDTIPVPSDLILKYNLGEYDLWSFSVNVSSTTLYSKQVVPIINLNDLDNFILGLEVIFHEGFHYYAAKTRCSPSENHLVTIKNRALEESAASTIGWLATQLFIEKYCSNYDLVKETLEEELAWQDEFTRYILDLYQSYDRIYRLNSPDSLKFELRLKLSEEKGPANNASLCYHTLYYRYRPLFKKIWLKNGPKKGIKMILEILRSDTEKLKKIK